MNRSVWARRASWFCALVLFGFAFPVLFYAVNRGGFWAILFSLIFAGGSGWRLWFGADKEV